MVWTSRSTTTMPRPRFATADTQLQRSILDAAKAEFAAKGYEAASLNRILLAAGLSKGSFYYWFDDKLDLAATVFIEAAKPMSVIDAFRPVATADEYWAELHRFTFDRLKNIDSKRAETEVVMKLAKAMLDEPLLRERILPQMAEGRATIAAFMQRGVELGAIRSDLSITVLLQLMQDVKMSLFKSLYPGEHVLTDGELASFSGLILDLMKRIAAPPTKGG